MPRSPRLLLSESYYHVMTRGNNKNTVFRCDEDYSYYLELLSRFKIDHPFDLYHYCLMPNHVHLLVKTNKASDFSTFMKRINLAYFHHYRQQYGWAGHFWQDRFKTQPVGKDAYFMQCGKYIELNPVRAKLVDGPKDYRFSSYNYYTNGRPSHLITPDFFYEETGSNILDRQQKYEKLIVNQVIEESYVKNAWGSNRQRYQETQKINRKINKA